MKPSNAQKFRNPKPKAMHQVMVKNLTYRLTKAVWFASSFDVLMHAVIRIKGPPPGGPVTP